MYVYNKKLYVDLIDGGTAKVVRLLWFCILIGSRGGKLQAGEMGIRDEKLGTGWV
jgi:hypothetical protein